MKTIGEKRGCLVSWIFAFVLISFVMLFGICTPHEVMPAYADSYELQAATSVKTNPSKGAIEKHIKHIANLRSKYVSDYTKTEKQKILELLKKAKKATKVKTARKAALKADKISKRAIKLHKSKARTIKSVRSDYKRLKGYLKVDERKELKFIISKMGKARLQSRLDKLKEKANRIFSTGKLRERYDAADWSDGKLYYVSEWGPRVDSYLEGTPMAGTGVMIARVAYDHGMDARLYPSIACVESGCGVAPYGSPYNVCGWIWYPPAMYSWEDACVKWHDFFQAYFGDEWYPISSMHGYGGYGPWYVNEQMAKI